MGRKKKEETKPAVYLLDNADKILDEHEKKIETDINLSLQVDPKNQYNMTEEQKTFIHLYCEFKNLQLVSTMMGISTEACNAYFISYSSQQEIRRINRAMLQRRFQTKMLNLNEIGGYLSTLITEENVALSERLSTKDKLQVASMLVDINKLKAETLANPNVIDYSDVEETAKNMSIDAIRTLLSAKSSNTNNKDAIISKMNVDNQLLPEEIDYLKTLSVTELLQMLNSMTK